MSNSILVAYTTKYGSTEEVAEKVAETLRESGFDVQTRPAASVASLEGYAAVVLGTALYMGMLHKDAKNFLNQHRDELKERPIAFFTLGPINNDEKDWQAARSEAQKELSKFPWLMPVAKEVFGGKFDPGKLGFPFKFIPPLRRMPANDARDWAVIQEWVSNTVVHAFQSAAVNV